MDVIQEVGAYAGFAAVVGLAVLAALFFSQARDLRRLREWAGRAPERAAEQAAAQDAALTPEPRPAPTGAVRPIPAAKPAPAAPAQTGAKPAAVAAKPATAAANAGAAAAAAAGTQVKPGETKPGEAKPEDKKTDEKETDEKKPGDEKPGEKKPAEKPATGAPAPATAAAAGPAPATAAAAPAAPKPAGPPVAPARPAAIPSRPAPAPVGRTPAPTPAAASQSTAVLPASARVRGLDRPDRGRDGLEGRYIALIVAGVLVLGAGAAFAVSQLGGDDDAPSTEERAGRDSEQPAGPLNRSLVTVSVLNGTTVPGLAAQIGDEIESKGFQRGNVANAIDQQRQESVVLYAEGAERPARVVARGLNISTVEPVDPDSQALAGNASVVVVVGADQTQ